MKAMTRQGLPRGVFALGFVSLFMDTSSEMIHSLLPVFLVSVLGASALAVGVIEGIAEGATAAVKAFVGPALALALMAASGDDYRLVFWIAILPAIASVAILVLAVQEPEVSHTETSRRFPIHQDEMGRLERRYWLVVAFAAVLTLARFSAADLLLAAADTIGLVAAGAVFWGLHMGTTQGLLAAMVAETAPWNLRGTAFGVFNFVTAGALLAASVLAGTLWSAVGPAMRFIAGAPFSAVALIGLLAKPVVAPRWH